MAVVDELGIVLEAYTRGLEEGLEKATKKTKEFEEQTEQSSLKTLESLAAQEALVSSLNQISGGYAKTITAAQELNIINEEQAKSYMKVRFAFELLAGPMEVIIAIQKIMTVVSLADIKAKISQISVTNMATTAQTRLNLAMKANPVAMIVMGVILLVLALIALEAKFGLVTKSVNMLKDGFEFLLEVINKVNDSMTGTVSKASELGDALAFGPVSGVLNTLGGR